MDAEAGDEEEKLETPNWDSALREMTGRSSAISCSSPEQSIAAYSW
jgi:hypothetical protein